MLSDAFLLNTHGIRNPKKKPVTHAILDDKQVDDAKSFTKRYRTATKAHLGYEDGSTVEVKIT